MNVRKIEQGAYETEFLWIFSDIAGDLRARNVVIVISGTRQLLWNCLEGSERWRHRGAPGYDPTQFTLI